MMVSADYQWSDLNNDFIVLLHEHHLSIWSAVNSEITPNALFWCVLSLSLPLPSGETICHHVKYRNPLPNEHRVLCHTSITKDRFRRRAKTPRHFHLQLLRSDTKRRERLKSKKGRVSNTLSSCHTRLSLTGRVPNAEYKSITSFLV